jgi:two-component system sensor histidine kinase/response regulator
MAMPAVPRILVVDDEIDLAQLIKHALERGRDAAVEIVTSGDAALQAVRTAPPDLVILDLNLPVVDGIDVCRRIRSQPSTATLPVIMLTARTAESDRVSGLDLGADDYITKPFTARDILDAVAARTVRQKSIKEKVTELSERHRREVQAHWSHELLTPLNAVMGSLDLLESYGDTFSKTELKEMLALIREGAERQERLSRKLIRYFSLEQMLQSPGTAPRGRCAGAGAIEAGAAKAAQEKRHAGSLSVAAAGGDVAVHEELLRDAVYEVVANAMTFSPAGAPITVNGSVHTGVYRVEITDQGPGLTAEQRSQIGAFTQFDRQKREQQGLGLGLAIAQATAKLAGGNLTLESGAGGKGLRVIFSLPLAGG